MVAAGLLVPVVDASRVYPIFAQPVYLLFMDHRTYRCEINNLVFLRMCLWLEYVGTSYPMV